MSTLRFLSRVCSTSPAPSCSELERRLIDMCVAGSGAVTPTRQGAAASRLFIGSTAHENLFRSRHRTIASMVALQRLYGVEPMRSFSTVLASTNILRSPRHLSRAGAKLRCSSSRGTRRGSGTKTRDAAKTKILTPEASFDRNFNTKYDHEDNDGESTVASSSDSAPSSAATPAGKADGPKVMGWGYETVDPVTGKTPIDLLYESHLDRIKHILESPLPPMPPDGHINPDFFVGFVYYRYHLREEYRAIIARELQVPVRAVKLSIAWSGRFDVSRFNKVQKVCGVYLERGALPGVTAHPTEKRVSQEETDSRLPEVVQERITALIRAINTRRTPHLLQVQLFQASEAIPEVEFALSRREHRLLLHLHSWIRANILSHSLAVIVRGGNLEHYRSYEQQLLGQPDLRRMDDFGSSDGYLREGGPSVRSCNGSLSPTQAYEEWLVKEAESAAQQQRFIDTKWLSQFHNREIVPRQLSIRSVAALVTQAVLQGEVGQVKVPCPREMPLPNEKGLADAGACQGENQATPPKEEAGDPLTGCAAERVSTDQDRDSTLLSADQVLLLRYCQSYLQRELQSDREIVDSQFGEGDSPALSQPLMSEMSLFANDDFMRTLEQNLQPIVLQWICTVRRALFLHEEGTSVAGSPASSGASVIRLPSLFVHRAYAGGLMEMRYLRSNKAAMDALLLHPNDIVMKKAFARRLLSGHQRLRIYEEMDTS